MKKIGLYMIAMAMSTLSFSQTSTENRKPPQWFIQHMEELNGEWITDNKDYKNEGEPWEAYGMEWKYGIGKMSLTGVLFGLKDGKRIGNFWEFRTYWNPADEKVYAEQFGGNGTYGVGVMTEDEIDQIFYSPDGSSNHTGHKAWFDEDGNHITQSFNITTAGEWIVSRSYTWKKTENN